MAQKWTQDQLRVITARGKSMLVSAAAGSGKTAVLVERILREILDPVHPVDLDRLLIVTFTRAATAQLRERVREAVTSALEADPGNPRLQRQMSLIHSDHIMTIDQFSLLVIREHYEEIGLDPSFRIGDEGELKLLRSDIAAEAIEEAYAEEGEKLQTFAECYAPGRDDRKLEDMILRFYEKSTSHPDPKAFRHHCVEIYREDPETAEWMAQMLQTVRTRLSDLLSAAQRALDIALSPDGPSRGADTLRDDVSYIRELLESRTYGDFRGKLEGREWKKLLLKPKKGDPEVSPDKMEEVKALRGAVKDGVTKIGSSFFPCPLDEVRELMRRTGDDLEILSDLTDRFEERFGEEKRKKNMLDFSDSAHLALRVLLVRQDDGSLSPSPAAKLYQDYFEEVAIDEYQDSNLVQEMMLWSVSRESRGGFNRFMVGDVKQSIYMFRESDPGIFMEKYRTYAKAEEGQEGSGQADDPADAGKDGRIRIDLHRNFRSRPQVLDAVNLIFTQLMRADAGGISYGKDEALNPGTAYPPYPEEAGGEAEEWLTPELILAEPQDPEESREREETENGAQPEEASAVDTMEAEARTVAERILQIAGKEPVWDSSLGAYRPALFRDIVILMRTGGRQANVFQSVLTKCGIPCRSESKTGYFGSPEVETVLSFLKVLDNPRQDIPLAASLRSEIGGLSDDELAFLKSGEERQKSRLYDCLTAEIQAAEADGDGTEDPFRARLREKLFRFLRLTEDFRAKAQDTPIHTLLWDLYDVTGFEQLCEVSRGGKQKKANLDMLVEVAMSYESTSYRGLFHFIRYIEKLKRYEIDLGQALTQDGSDDLVSIMTIHKSKGLEFPIVFVSGLGRQFNRMDSRSKQVIDSELGYGMNWVDPVRRVECPVLLRSVIAGQSQVKSLGEELRVLYVAMTRAKEKLILTAGVKSREAEIGRLEDVLHQHSEKLSWSAVTEAKGMLQWVLSALLRHGAERPFFEEYLAMDEVSCPEAENLPGAFRILTGAEVLQRGRRQESGERESILRLADAQAEGVCDAGLAERLSRQTGAVYPHAASAAVPAKVTVSELKIRAMQGMSQNGGPVLSEEGPDAADLMLLDGRRQSRAEEASGTPEGETAPGSGTWLTDGDDGIIVPEFMKESGQKRKSGAFRGTAYHKFLADVDFGGEQFPPQAAPWLETMVQCDKITEEEARLIDPAHLDSFLAAPLAMRMHEAAQRGELWRENPFVMQVRAGEVSEHFSSSEETVLVQGTVDACFLEQDGMVLVDYKTDHVRAGREQELAARYRRQFELYREAIQRLTGRPVKEAILYSLFLDRAVPVTF